MTNRSPETLRRLAAYLVTEVRPGWPQTEAYLRCAAKQRGIPLDYLDRAIGDALLRGEIVEYSILNLNPSDRLRWGPGVSALQAGMTSAK